MFALFALLRNFSNNININVFAFKAIQFKMKFINKKQNTIFRIIYPFQTIETSIFNANTIFIVIISFLIFNASSLQEITTSLKNMFLINKIPLVGPETLYYLKNYLVLIIISIIGATPLPKLISEKIHHSKLKRFTDI